MLPYRFKAGSVALRDNMGGVPGSTHHHRSTTKQDHKPFKSKHATKSALKEAAKGKVEGIERGSRRTPHQQVMSKLQRRNQAKQLRNNHKTKQEQDSSIFRGSDGAPKHVAVVPLTAEVDVRKAINGMLAAVDVEPSMETSGVVRTWVDRYGRNVLFMPATTDMLTALDICKLADLVLFVLDVNQDIEPDAHNLLKVVEAQGITNAMFAVQQGEHKIPDNKLNKRLSEVKAQAEHYFPDLEKIIMTDNKNDCSLAVRKICTGTTKGIRWRDARSWMLIDGVEWQSAAGNDVADIVLQGVVRGKNLSPDRLVHVPGWGEYQIVKITEVPKKAHKRKADQMAMEEDVRTHAPTADQDDLAELAPESVEMQDTHSVVARSQQKGVLLDDHHYFSDDNSHVPARPQKLPAGTSNYQSAWYLEDVSDSDEDMVDDEEMGTEMATNDAIQQPEDGGFMAPPLDAMTEAAGTEYPESVMHVDATDEEEARQLAEFRASRKREAAEDLEFPDEIELHPDVLARERLAKYRGLKSLRTSEWNTAEDAPYQPLGMDRLLQIPDYKKSHNSAIKDSLAGGVTAGTRVLITLGSIPVVFQSQPAPSSLFSLLRHEHKHTINNINITLDSSLTAPIRSKDELIVQIGHRRLAINPIFSAAGNTPNNVHKFDRYIHPGRTAVASFIGPLTWGSVPVLVFKRTPTPAQSSDSSLGLVCPEPGHCSTPSTSTLTFIGTATTLPPSTSSSRIIAKRIILTGHPYKIHKKLVTVRYMFFNRGDVEWFKALPLWTKRGRQGFIKEPLGTHGYFKATFDAKITGMDAVGVSLYKRVWPRESRSVN